MLIFRLRRSGRVLLPWILGLAAHLGLACLNGKETFERSFDTVWNTVNESFWDEDFNGVDWEQVGARYRRELGRIEDRRDLAVLLQSMLDELGQSHFQILNAPSDPWFLAPEGGYTGIYLKYTSGGTYVVRVEPGSVAHGEGIQVGWKLKSIDGKSTRRIIQSIQRADIPEKRKSFLIQLNLGIRINGSTGKQLRTDWYPSHGRVVRIDLTPARDERELSEPIGFLPGQRLEYEETYLRDRALYLRFNYFMPALMEKIRRAIETAEGRAIGLILDLRGNYGGLTIMAAGIAGLLIEEPTRLGKMTMRKGHLNYQGYPQEKRFTGPVAILIDHCSISTAEMLAAGLQEAGRARLFGEVSQGNSLPSLFKKLPSGDVLQYAMGDFTTPKGIRIENNGVVPDVLIDPEPEALAAGMDIPLQSALEWLGITLSLEGDDEV